MEKTKITRKNIIARVHTYELLSRMLYLPFIIKENTPLTSREAAEQLDAGHVTINNKVIYSYYNKINLNDTIKISHPDTTTELTLIGYTEL